MILSNQVKCLNCGDEPFSAYRHDFKSCKCGRVSVDGGQDYLRRSYKDNAEYIDLSIQVDELTVEMCMSALEWCEDTGRNDFGKVCAIFRALRDTGYLDKGKGKGE